MPFKDLLKKKETLEADGPVEEEQPVFTFMRTDTHTQEIISPPSFSGDEPPSYLDSNAESRTSRFFKGRPRSTSASSTASGASRASQKSKSDSPKTKRLSQRLHLRRSEVSSASVPDDLPEIKMLEDDRDASAGVESQWEKRATILARKNEESRSRPTTPVGRSGAGLESFQDMNISGRSGKEKGVVSTKYVDDNIQEAIRLHEAGELETSTRMFGRLADPNGENNALSQVLYGLALRHGWGCTPNTAEAVKYLSAAASNAASIEDLALQAGLRKGGAAKGELVLAIFELGNCFRHGWGVEVDKVAAKQVRPPEVLDREAS
jgi:TPR repeat protein